MKRWIAPWGMSLGAHVALLFIVAPQMVLPISVSEHRSKESFLHLQVLKESSTEHPKLWPTRAPKTVSEQQKRGPKEAIRQDHFSDSTPQNALYESRKKKRSVHAREPKSLQDKSASQKGEEQNTAPPNSPETLSPDLWRKYIAAAIGVEVDKVKKTTHISDRNIEINVSDKPASQRRATSLVANTPTVATTPLSPSEIPKHTQKKASNSKIQAEAPKHNRNNAPLDHAITTTSNPDEPKRVLSGQTYQERTFEHRSVGARSWWQPTVSRVLTNDRMETQFSDSAAFQSSKDPYAKTKRSPHREVTDAESQARVQKAERQKPIRKPKGQNVSESKIKSEPLIPDARHELETMKELQETFTQITRHPSEPFTVIRTRNQGHQDSVFASQSHEGIYRGLIDEIISERWLSMPIDGSNSMFLRGATTIEFMVRRTGRVARVRLTKTSGHSSLDLIALQSIPKRLPKLPREISSKKMHHQYTFRYINPSLSK